MQIFASVLKIFSDIIQKILIKKGAGGVAGSYARIL